MDMQTTNPPGKDGFKKTIGRDFVSSFVVFLVALPLCLGIAIASGVPAELGLITGIIGGLVVGSIAGQPLQVSGPAAGLAVLVFQLVQSHGVEALGPVLLVAGLAQFIAGRLKLGQLFRGVSPAVVHGMLAGIGALIVVQQAHVLLDDTPLSSGLANLAAIPGAFFGMSDNAFEAFAVGATTIVAMIAWDKFKPSTVRMLPGALIGVIAGTAVAIISSFGVKRIELPENIIAGLNFPTTTSLSMLADPTMIGLGLAFAFIASAETLLSAAAVERMQNHWPTKYDKELSSQGVGNFLCGIFGALPMTGVIVRSSVNVQSGARTRLSTMLHGTWLLAFVALLPFVLSEIPTAALAGVLVVTGFKLMKVKDVRHLFDRYGPLPALIWAVTFILVVTVDLLTGVVAGLALTLIELIPHMRRLRLNIRETKNDDEGREIALEGRATAIGIRKIAKFLDHLPKTGKVRLDVSRLDYVDHTVNELLRENLRRKRETGLDVTVENRRNEQHEQLAAAIA